MNAGMVLRWGRGGQLPQFLLTPFSTHHIGLARKSEKRLIASSYFSPSVPFPSFPPSFLSRHFLPSAFPFLPLHPFPFDPASGLGRAVSSPKVLGQSPTAKRFRVIFSANLRIVRARTDAILVSSFSSLYCIVPISKRSLRL